jgi:hypothetical protein
MTAHYVMEIDDYTRALTSWNVELMPPEVVKFDNGGMSSKYFSATDPLPPPPRLE